MRIEMTGIIVNDPHEAYKFYTSVLGFVEVMYVPDRSFSRRTGWYFASARTEWY